ncbi:MAG TPA: hypothetical protein VN829_15685, partial [Dongiaceae bacterium]|nr:hypothetical protein [Dongiaceae bacterium]
AISGDYLTTDITSGRQVPYPDGAIVYNNAFYSVSAAVGSILDSYFDPWTNGLVFAQNIIECATNGVRQLIAISGQTATETPVNNVIFWHNDVLGRGADLAYNNYGTTYCQRVFWSLQNNLFDKLDIKSDTGDNPNGVRTGDWPEVFGVGYAGNLNANTAGVGASGSFNPEFPGLSSFQPPTGGSSPSGFFEFVDSEAFDGVTNGAGDGDYHLTGGSPALGVSCGLVLPFDLDGRLRSTGNAPGAYAAPAAQFGELTLTASPPDSSGQFQLSFRPAVIGTTYVLEGTTDLVNWVPVATNLVSATPWSLPVTNTSGLQARFYRVRGPGSPYSSAAFTRTVFRD